MVGKELTDRVRYCLKSWLPAKQIVEKTITSRHEVREDMEWSRVGELRIFHGGVDISMQNTLPGGPSWNISEGPGHRM